MEIKGELQLVRVEEELDLEPKTLKTCDEYPGIPQGLEHTWPLRIAGYLSALGAQDGDLICAIDDEWPTRKNFLDLCAAVGKGESRRGVIVFESITRRRKWATRYEVVKRTP